jgi:hypothetical protein
MFLEDVAIGIMPIGGQFMPERVKINLAPSNEENETMIAQALNRNHRRELADGVCEFLRTVARAVCEEGQEVFEIVYLHEDPAKDPVAFDLTWVNGRQLSFTRSGVHQVIPPDIAKKRNLPRHISLPSERLLVFTLPRAWRDRVRDALAMLNSLGDPSLHALVMEAQDKGIPYEFAAHHRYVNLALAEIGRSIGWTARGAFNREVLSYVWIRMQLQFARFKIELRNHLLGELNEGLARVGAKCGFKGAIVTEGLPTDADVEEALRRLDEGKAAFTQVMKGF